MSDILKLIEKLKFIRDYECKTMAEINSMNDAITELSAQPEPHWIPVSERLPEDGLYLVTTSKGQTQVHVFNHNGNSEEYWMRCNKAWMPLPEPYQEGGE